MWLLHVSDLIHHVPALLVCLSGGQGCPSNRKTRIIFSTCIFKTGSSLVAQELRICLQCRRHEFDTWARKIPWRRKQQPSPVFLPGKSHGQRSLVVNSPRCRKRVGHNLATKQQHIQKYQEREFPGGSVVRTWHFYCWGPGFDPYIWELRSHMLHCMAKSK